MTRDKNKLHKTTRRKQIETKNPKIHWRLDDDPAVDYLSLDDNHYLFRTVDVAASMGLLVVFSDCRTVLGGSGRNNHQMDGSPRS